MADAVNKPFEDVAAHWKSALQKAIEYKRKNFDEDAEEARKFLKGGSELAEIIFGAKSRGDFVVNSGSEGVGLPAPDFNINTNRVAEMLDLFGPHLYHRNPNRLCSPREQLVMPQGLFFQPMPQMMPGVDPQMMQQFMQQMLQQQEQQYQQYLQEITQEDSVDKTVAMLQQAYLNYTPSVLGLKGHMRMGINECIVTGLGWMSCEVYRPHGSNRLMVGNFFESPDNVVIDPDMETIEDAKVHFRRRIRPVWEFEDQYTIPNGMPRGYLKGNVSSYNAQAGFGTHGLDAFKAAKGETNDLMVVWEVYSKMGLGGRIAGAAPELRDALDAFGDNVYLVLCNNCPLPLNVLGAKDGEDLQRRLRWPTPFWADDAWPLTPIQFHPQSRCCYPYSHVKPGLGELKFLSWCYSFIAGKIRNTSRDFMAVLKQAGAELKQQLVSGGDLSVLEISTSDGGKIGDIVQFLSHPEFNSSIWDVLQAIEQQFERRVGLTPLLYGESPTQARLATSAEFQQARGMVRVEDMADMVEVSATDCSRKEGLAAAYHLEPERDIQPVLGRVPSQMWGQYVRFEELLSGMSYRVEADSIRKPNAAREQSNMDLAVQTVGPILERWASATMDVDPFNALMMDWAKAHQIDGKRYQLTAPPPPDPSQPTPEQLQMQMEQQQMQAELAADQQRLEMEMQAKQMDAQLQQQQAAASMQAEQQRTTFDLLKGQQQLVADERQAQQDLSQDDRAFQLEMRQLATKHQLEMRLLQEKAAAAKKVAASKPKAKPAARKP